LPDQITEDSMLALYTALRKRGNRDRTLCNKATSLGGWFKFMKLSVKEIIPQNPAFTEKDVEIYSPLRRPGHERGSPCPLRAFVFPVESSIHFSKSGVEFANICFKNRHSRPLPGSIPLGICHFRPQGFHLCFCDIELLVKAS
jgi:hypothetical protein